MPTYISPRTLHRAAGANGFYGFSMIQEGFVKLGKTCLHILLQYMGTFGIFSGSYSQLISDFAVGCYGFKVVLVYTYYCKVVRRRSTDKTDNQFNVVCYQ